jgi:hypothetical protein
MNNPICGAKHPLLKGFTCNLLISHMSDPDCNHEHRMYHPHGREYAAWPVDLDKLGIEPSAGLDAGAKLSHDIYDNLKNEN